MSINSQVDPSTLGWVKTEIDETLKQARLALETYAADKADDSRLRFCITHLHQVVGTLLMVELDGPAMLAKETEALAEALYDDKVASPDITIEVLVRGILTIPDYLSRLQYGQPDTPVRLVPLVNEMRAERGEALISELEFFRPDLTVRPPESQAAEKLSHADYITLAKRQRPVLQQAMLTWLRSGDDPTALQGMLAICQELGVSAPLPQMEQLFWAATGLLEAFADKGLVATNERKRLFSRLDQSVKKLIDGADKSAIRELGEALTRAMLFEVGMASSTGGRVSTLKKAFRLDQLLPESTEMLEDFPSPEALKSIGDALGHEIAEVQEILSAYYDEERDDVVSIEGMLDPLSNMSSTLEMLGIKALKILTDALINAVKAVIDGKIADPETAAMPLARALLVIEQSAREMQGSPRVWKQQVDDAVFVLENLYGDEQSPSSEGLEVSDGDLSDSEFRQLASVVGEEVRANLAAIEAAFETFMSDPGRLEALRDVPPNLGQIQGALQILSQDQAADFAGQTAIYVEDLIARRLIASPQILDALAVSISTIGAYMHGLQFSRSDIDALLSQAASGMKAALATRESVAVAAMGPKALAALASEVHAGVAEWISKPADDSSRDRLASILSRVSERAEQEQQPTVAQIARQMGNLIEIVKKDSSQLNEDSFDALRESAEHMLDLVFGEAESEELEAPPPPDTVQLASQASSAGDEEFGGGVQSAPVGVPPKVELNEDVDEEILEIFIEDARDCQVNIERDYPKWRDHPDDFDILKEVRRYYHTLKGSGRMVGAGEIAELAWSVENMLNKLRDRLIAHSPDMIEVLDRVAAALPGMIDYLEGGPVYTTNTEAMRLAAEAIAEGKTPDLAAMDLPWGTLGGAVVEPSEKKTVRSETASARAKTDTALPDLDPTLRQIFTNEAQGHLEVLHEEIARCREEGGCKVSAKLMRAIHTLRGNARSVGIEAMSDVCGNMETLLQGLESMNRSLGHVHLAYLDRIHGDVTALISLIVSGIVDGGEVIERLAVLKTEIEYAFGSTGSSPVSDALRSFLPPVVEEAEDVSGDESIALASPPEEVPEPASYIADADIQTDIEAPLTEFDLDFGVEELSSVDGDTASDDFANDPVRALDFGDIDMSPDFAADGSAQDFESEVTKQKTASGMAPVAPRSSLDDEVISEEIDPELMEIFHEEAVDLMETVSNALADWRDDTENRAAIADLKRALHTIKGGARMAGATTMGSISHATESLLEQVELGTLKTSPELHDLLDESCDVLHAMLDQEEAGQPLPEAYRLVARLNAVVAGGSIESQALSAPVAAAAVDEIELAPVPEDIKSPDTERVPSESGWQGEADRRQDRQDRRSRPRTGTKEDRRGTSAAHAQIRVRTELLDNLVNYAGEVSISRSRMEQQIFGFREHLVDLQQNVSRFREQLRELEIQSESQIMFSTGREAQMSEDFDPLEFDRFTKLQYLSRGLTESLHDLATIQQGLGGYVSEAEVVLMQQARINTDLQEGLMRTRMVGFSTQAARLRAIVRQTAREVGKLVELDLGGADVEIDRNVLERMIGPFEHMIRNAIDHGIEDAVTRKRAGKSEQGIINISSTQEGSEIVIRFSDDGAGLNVGAIRNKAIDRGLMAADSMISDEEVVQFILIAGFSTAEKVTQLSGRGVGMDVVHNEVKQLGGIMAVDTLPGQGTTFTIRLPLTLSITQALMVTVGEQIFAVPISSVDNIIEIPVESLAEIYGAEKPVLKYADSEYSYMHLADPLGMTISDVDEKKIPVLLVRSGAREVAMQVDALIGTREVVIKPLSPQLSALPSMAGATILGDGSVILILDVAGLLIGEEAILVTRQDKAATPSAPEVPSVPLVMVVDDSLTVRKVTNRALSKRGFEVLLAKDGQDAVEQLQRADRLPDVMLVDIEMPRMDGFELTSRVRSTVRFAEIPIIMITSRTGDKHRNRAMNLGVNRYLGKPYQEDVLVETINELLSQKESA